MDQEKSDSNLYNMQVTSVISSNENEEDEEQKQNCIDQTFLKVKEIPMVFQESQNQSDLISTSNILTFNSETHITSTTTQIDEQHSDQQIEEFFDKTEVTLFLVIIIKEEQNLNKKIISRIDVKTAVEAYITCEDLKLNKKVKPDKSEYKKTYFQIDNIKKMPKDQKATCYIRLSKHNAGIISSSKLNYIRFYQEKKSIKCLFYFQIFQHDEDQYLENFFQPGKLDREFYILQPPQGKNHEGAFGRILLCMNKYDQQIYAIKELFDLDIPKKKMFGKKNQQQEKIYDMDYLREAHNLMRLSHPNIVRCYNWWVEKNTMDDTKFKMYIQMEFVGDLLTGGSNLFKYAQVNLKESNFATLQSRRQQIFKIFDQIWTGIRYFHQFGYVHRDMKPENILIDTQIQPPQVKITDFGFSKMIEDQVNELGDLILNKQPSKRCTIVEYQPPESTLIYDQYSEILILGLILFDIINCMKERKKWHISIIYSNLFPEYMTQDYFQEMELIKLMCNLDYDKRVSLFSSDFDNKYNDWIKSLSN